MTSPGARGRKRRRRRTPGEMSTFQSVALAKISLEKAWASSSAGIAVWPVSRARFLALASRLSNTL
eukprot:576125-Lingulodinium_polyedra.AAC.1